MDKKEEIFNTLMMFLDIAADNGFFTGEQVLKIDQLEREYRNCEDEKSNSKTYPPSPWESISKLEKVKFLIDQFGMRNKQAFNTRNIAGDEMETLYRDSSIQIDYCNDWDYLEIFGLTSKEFYSLSDILDID